MATNFLCVNGGGSCLLVSLLICIALHFSEAHLPLASLENRAGQAGQLSFPGRESLLQFAQNLKRNAPSPDSLSAINSVEEEEEELEPQILWGRSCSPRQALAPKYQDLHLLCEAWVPAGSTFTWYKDNEVQTSPQNYIETPWQKDMAGYEQVYSYFYIDCTQEANEGIYRLVVTTPMGEEQERLFTLRLIDATGSFGRGCRRLMSNRVATPPRITDFSRTVEAVEGRTAMVRCRVDGRNFDVKWRFNKAPIEDLNGTKYKMSPSGDLIIHNVTPEDAGKYRCRVRSNRGRGYSDRITAFLFLVN